MEQVKVTLVKSLIDKPHKQKNTIQSLGINRREQSVVKPKNDQIMGMIHKVQHLVKVETV